MPPLSKSIIVISGLGNAVGTGAAVARLFSSQLGYRVALLSRPRKDVEDLKKDIVAAGGVVSARRRRDGEGERKEGANAGNAGGSVQSRDVRPCFDQGRLCACEEDVAGWEAQDGCLEHGAVGASLSLLHSSCRSLTPC